MGMFDFLWGERRSLENPQVPLSDPRAVALLFGDNYDAAGENVTVETAMEVTAFWDAVNFMAGTIAALPLHHYRRQSDGTKERVKGSQVEGIVHERVNSEQSSFEWRAYSMAMTLMLGRSYTFVERNRSGRVMNLWPLEPEKVTVTTVVNERKVPTKVYEFRPSQGAPVKYTSAEIIDICFMMKPDQVTHFSPLNQFRRAIGLSIALERYATTFFHNGGVPPLQLTGPFKSVAGVKKAASDIGEAIWGARVSKRSVIALPDGHELKQIGFDPEKGQMKEAREFQVIEIARIFNLPPTFLQDLSRATFTNSEQQDLHFVKHTLGQWIKRWEAQLNLKIFPKSRNEFLEFNVDGLLRGDFKTRMEGSAIAIQNAMKTPNEIREKSNEPAMPGGDKLYIQGATVPIDGTAQADGEAQ